MSTKRIRLLTALIAVFAAVMLTFAGCKVGGRTTQDILDEGQLTARVIYYANEGKFNNEENIRSVYFKAETPVLNIAQEGYLPTNSGSNKYPNNIYVSNSGYLLEGWEYAELDENNNPLFIDTDGTTLRMHVFTEEEQGIEIPTDEYSNPLTGFDNEKGELVFRSEKAITAKSSGTPVDFTKKIADGEKWYFVASWVSDVRLNYVLVCDEPVTIGGTEYNTGDTVYKASYGKGSSVTVASYAPASTDATFLQAYSDELCENAVTTVNKPTDGNDAQVYVKYIPGIWDIVRTPLEVSDMFSGLRNADKQFYLFADIDCSNISVSPNPGDMNCVIRGNGHTLKNLTVRESNIGGNRNVSLFGNIGANALIDSLKFENLNVRLETRNNVTASLYMFCGGVEEGASISGVELINANLTFGDARQQTVISNIPRVNETYTATNWMFGGLGTDEAFLAKYGVTLNGYSLKVILNFEGDTDTIVSVDPAE